MFEYLHDFASGDVTLHVRGDQDHQHSKPPPKRPGPISMALIAAAVQSGGKKPTPVGLLVSQSLGDDLGAQDTGKLQRLIAEMYKGRYGEDLTAAGLFKQEFGEPFVRDVAIAHGEAECPDTNFDFVFLQLDGQIELTKDLASLDGLLTSKYLYADVTYAFGSMYRLTIMTDSLESGKGVTLCVILLTRLHTGAYKRAFYTFLKKNPALWMVQDGMLVLMFCCIVVDFSDSQKNGFVAAIEKLWMELSLGPFSERTKLQFWRNLKGCFFHWKQSVKHVAHNANVVPIHMQAAFTALADNIYNAADMPQFEEAVQCMQQRFPKSRTWMRWWTQPGHRILIFRACRNSELQEELQEFFNMPTANNVVESNNRTINRFLSYKQMPVVVAAHDVFKFCQHEIRQIRGIRTGHVTVGHREAGRRKRVSNMTDEYKDGKRAPTSTGELLGGSAAKDGAAGKPAVQQASRQMGTGSSKPPAAAGKKLRRGALLIHPYAERVRRVNALIAADEATAGYFVEIFSSGNQTGTANQ